MEHARQWANIANSDKQEALANLHFAQRNWPGAIQEYEKIPTKSKLDLYRYIVAINQISKEPDYKKMIPTLIRDHKLNDLPAFQLELAEACINQGKFEDAADILYTLESSEMPYIHIQAYQKLARSLLMEGKMDTAFNAANKALKLSEEINNKKGQAYSLYLMSLMKARQEAFDEGKKLAVRGTIIAHEAGNRSIEFHLNNIKSWTFFATGEDFNILLAHEARQAQLVIQLNDELKKADVYNNLGYDLTVAGHVPLDSAIHLMQLANSTYAKNEGHKGRWYTLMNLAWQHRLKGDYSESGRYADLSVKQALAVDDRHAVIEAASQYGETLLAQGKIDQASIYYQMGMKWRGEQEDRDSYVFDVYYAKYLWATGKKDQAIKMLEAAVNFLTTSEVFYEMHGRALLAKYYFELQQFDRAREQINVVENPRSNYVSFESKIIASNIKAKLLEKADSNEIADNVTYAYYYQADLIGARQLMEMLQE